MAPGDHQQKLQYPLLQGKVTLWAKITHTCSRESLTVSCRVPALQFFECESFVFCESRRHKAKQWTMPHKQKTFLIVTTIYHFVINLLSLLLMYRVIKIYL